MASLKKEKCFLLMLLAFLLYVPVHAQINLDNQTKLAERFHVLSENAPPEIAYIQTSKDIYETGEDLWFKIYLLDSRYLMPSLLSKTLYLQLLNSSTRKAVWKEKYEIQDGFANGRVYLDNSLPEGDYLLATYTENSFYNDTSEFKAVKRIIIKQDMITPMPIAPKSQTSDTSQPNQKIQFATFPEGGNLVSGLRSKLAFKAINSGGEPVDVEGTLFENDQSIQKFKSYHAGMGSFGLTPDASKKYHIRLTRPLIDSIFHLPEIEKSGMILNLVARGKDTLTFKIAQSQELQESDFYVRAQCRGVIYVLATGKVKNEAMFKMPLSLFPQGIAEVTLFNGDLVPVAERLVYINPDRKILFTVNLSKDIFPTRGKVDLKITAKDESGYPVSANLGVSVFDKLYQNFGDSGNILSHLYLASQLKGRIYNPSYYFTSKSKNREEALDLLMLTQGWRKYIWSENNLNSIGETKKKVIFDGVSGEIYIPERKNKIPRDQTFVMAFAPNKDSLKIIIPADTVARFDVSTELLKRSEDDYIYLKPFASYPNQQVKSWDPLALPEYELHIKLTDPFETINQLMLTKHVCFPLENLNISFADTLNRYEIDANVFRINDVSIKGKRSNLIRGKYLGMLDSLAKYDYLASRDDYVCFYGVLNCPRHVREPGCRKPIDGMTYSKIMNYQLINEYVVDVRYHAPVTPRYSEQDLLKINNLVRVKGYYGRREFYQPNYDLNKGEQAIPDFRNTLLWKPSVITDENGEATLSFYSSDVNTDFVGRIEGVSDDGVLGAGTFKFTVRKELVTP